jgi:hypothetical protein
MSTSSTKYPESPAVKDRGGQHPVASAWRETFHEIVSGFATGDFELKRRVLHVEPISQQVADQIRSYLQSYGETLVELPEETWRSSASQWMDGYWDVLVDLWTLESGASDLALSARVREHGEGFLIEIQGLHVP